MKYLVIALLCASPAGMHAMEKTFETFKEEVRTACLERRFKTYVSGAKADVLRFAQTIVAEVKEVLAREDATHEELKLYGDLLQLCYELSQNQDIAGYSCFNFLNLQSSLSNRINRILGDRKQAAEKIAYDAAQAEQRIADEKVKTLVIAAYNQGGYHAAAHALNAHFTEPLPPAPEGMDPDMWSKCYIRKAPTFEIGQFVQRIQVEVLAQAQAIVENPQPVAVDDIRRVLALLLPLRINTETNLKSIGLISQLEEIVRLK